MTFAKPMPSIDDVRAAIRDDGFLIQRDVARFLGIKNEGYVLRLEIMGKIPFRVLPDAKDYPAILRQCGLRKVFVIYRKSEIEAVKDNFVEGKWRPA